MEPATLAPRRTNRENISKYIVQDADVQELMQLLQLLKRRKEAGELYEIVSYIDSLENKLDLVVGELNTVRKQLEEVKELNERKPLKTALADAVEKLEISCQIMKEQLFEIKKDVKEKAKDVIESVKEKGISGLNQFAEFLGIGNKLKSIKEKLESDLEQVNSTLNKIDMAGLEIKKAATSIGNISRVLVGKELKEVQDKRGFSISDIIKAPWNFNQKCCVSMIKCVEGATEKLESLSEQQEHRKIEKRDNVAAYSNLSEATKQPEVAENFLYNGDAFDAFQKSSKNKKPNFADKTKETKPSEKIMR